jgi:hypothetical protein
VTAEETLGEKADVGE